MRSWMLWMVVAGCTAGVDGGDSDTEDTDVEDPETPYTWLDEAHSGPPCDGFAEGPWYVDADGDGYGASGEGEPCRKPGLVNNDRDCEDEDAAIHPGAAELACDGVDDDCDPNTVEDTYLRVGDETFETLDAALQGREGEVRVEICPGEWDFTEVSVQAEVTDLQLVGLGPRGEVALVGPGDNSDALAPMPAAHSGSLTLENLVLGTSRRQSVSPTFGATSDLTLTDVRVCNEIQASTLGGHVRIERTDVWDCVLLEDHGRVDIHAHDLTVLSSQLDGSLSATGNLELRDLEGLRLTVEPLPSGDTPPRPFDIDGLNYIDLDDNVFGNLTIKGHGRLHNIASHSLNLHIDGPSDIRGITKAGHGNEYPPVSVFEYDPPDEEPLELVDVVFESSGQGHRIVAGAPMVFRNLVFLEGDRTEIAFEGDAPIRWIQGSAIGLFSEYLRIFDVRTDLILEDVEILRSRIYEAPESVFRIDGGTLTLDRVTVSRNSLPEVGGMDDADEPTWDGEGEVSVFCDESGCVPLE